MRRPLTLSFLILSVAAGPSAAQWSWNLTTNLPGENIGGIWAASPSQVFASGGYRTLDGFNGSSWFSYAQPPGANRYRVWGTSFTDVWSPGQSNLLHFDGTSWTESFQGGTELFGVWSNPEAGVFTVGDGTMYHFDGVNWTSVSTGLQTCHCNRLEDIWGSDANHVWAVGAAGHILRTNGVTATQEVLPVDGSVGFNDIYGTSAHDVWVVGTGGTVLHYDGSVWTIVPTPVASNLIGVFAFARNDVYVTSQNGLLMHYDGRHWNLINTGTSRDLFAIYGLQVGRQRLLYIGAATDPNQSLPDRGAILTGTFGMTTTPEPTTWILTGTGLVVLALFRRRRA